MKKMSLLNKCVLSLSFLATLAFANIASAGGLTNVSMTPTLATDPGFNNPTSTPTINLGTMDSSTVLNFTFTNTSPMNVATVVYPKITAGSGVIGFSTTTVSTQTQQMEVSTTVGTLLSTMGCNTTSQCTGTITIGWGISTDSSFTDSLTVNFVYR